MSKNVVYYLYNTSINGKGESMSEEKITFELYKKYVDGLLSSNDLPDFAKAYQLKCDREYKSYTYLTINYYGKSYKIKNGEVKIGDKKYSLRENYVPGQGASKYGCLNIGNQAVEICHDDMGYADLSEGAKYKVNRTVARAMAYIESKKLTSQISYFAEKTNSTNPPYDEIFDEYNYYPTDDNYRISSFKSYVKTEFDKRVDIDFGHNTLNLYGLTKLIEYKQNIVKNVQNNQYFDKGVSDVFSNRTLKIRVQNSDVLKNIIFNSANNLEIDTDKIGQLTSITGQTAKGFLKQLSLISGNPMFVKSLGETEINNHAESDIYNKTESRNEAIDYIAASSDDMDEDYEPAILFDENGYTVSLDSNGNYIYNNTKERYYGIVYSEDGCPRYDPKEEYRLLKQTVPSSKRKDNDLSKETK